MFRQVYVYVLIWVCVTSKNISITEDVYKMLSRLRLEGESFSDAIRRLAKRGSISECAGLWEDMEEGEVEAIRDGASTARSLFNESMRRHNEAS